MAPQNPVYLRLIAAIGGVFPEPAQDIRIQPDGHRLLERAIELTAAGMDPVFHRCFRDVRRVDLVFRKRGNSGKLDELFWIKRFLFVAFVELM